MFRMPRFKERTCDLCTLLYIAPCLCIASRQRIFNYCLRSIKNSFLLVGIAVLSDLQRFVERVGAGLLASEI